MATPHTRGSTAVYRSACVIEQGYPAYAGIDPWTLSTVPEKKRLPRIRGDRPISLSLMPAVDRATPHTRGSTPLDGPVAVNVRGYPAYAGIDLLPTVFSSLRLRLPRIRGDRPYLDISRNLRSQATPHTRGSTSIRCRYLLLRHGYPAYAGIDPRRRLKLLAAKRLPRIRGDRPF